MQELGHLKKEAFILPEHFITEPLIDLALPSQRILKMVWIGSIDARKNLGLLIDVLIQLKEHNWTLDVIGKGSNFKRLAQLVKNNNLENKIFFRGHIPRNEVINILQNSNLHVMTTLSDATTSVLFEAFTNQVPTIALNHCGMADLIIEKCGYLVSLEVENYSDLVTNFRNTLIEILNNPKALIIKR